MAYTRAPFINMNPALLGPQQPAFALQPINPVEAPIQAVPAPAPVVKPALPPEARDGGGFGEIALKALQMFQNQQAQSQQTPGYLGAPTGGAVMGLGLKGVQGLQENRLRENMANAQLAQQRQRDLMQQQAQEEARAEQVNFQKMKFKNDMDLKKMEEQQKKADRDYERNKPENVVKGLKAQHEIEDILNGVTTLSPEKRNAIAKTYVGFVQDGMNPEDAKAMIGSQYDFLDTGAKIRVKPVKGSGGGGQGGIQTGGGVLGTDMGRLTNYIQEFNTTASPELIVEDLKQKGITVTPEYVNAVRKTGSGGSVMPYTEMVRQIKEAYDSGTNPGTVKDYIIANGADPAMALQAGLAGFALHKQEKSKTEAEQTEKATKEQEEKAEKAAKGDTAKKDFLLRTVKDFTDDEQIDKASEAYDIANSLSGGGGVTQVQPSGLVVTMEDLLK